jgi:hypothetical protein
VQDAHSVGSFLAAAALSWQTIEEAQPKADVSTVDVD